ncbi:bacillithiol biosynthesis cysteine-adding enzyme BshC [Flavobacteriaceae bacterium 14752]|uniref:bacillithiol biosynthesis cysteine-adding enzyme BshC n=1 Tax=Mesohalobacter salilacus TaxID=2491711 RepID=UPI000F639E85|nr:bacillithiol biosynthesis cysteine-adding enzyme BshC [Flavobacteriaceae bacterium 14752]
MDDCLNYEQTQLFSNLFLDYINQKSSVSSFYNRFPNLQNFAAQIQDKQSQYNQKHRAVLVDVLNKQYQDFETSKQTQNHINQLSQSNTFTITTGHQLNLFTGPLYTFYKIITVLKTCEQLKTQYPDFNFVPLFWLASEDHDFEEINHFHFKDKTISWPKKASGAVGELDTNDLKSVFETFEDTLPKTQLAEELKNLFKQAYLKHKNLSEASIYLYNQLFGSKGLVILEPNHKKLKACFKNQIRTELLEQITYKEVTQTSEHLKSQNYHEQVTPREINLFYKDNNLRERLILKDNKFFVNSTQLEFSKDEILNEVETHPEKFSPNALMRPLYQEVLLPNLSYVGGAGELAYWLQLQSTFEAFEIPFPMLQMRNSALLFSEKTKTKLDKLDLKVADLFQSTIDLKNQQVKKISKIDIDFTPQKEHLSQQFKALYKLAKQTDKTFLNAVAAQEKKQHNGLNKLEKRLLKAQRRQLADQINRSVKLQDKLFPKQNLQERIVNFSELYLARGEGFIEFLYENFEPFDFSFSVLKLKTNPKSLNQSFVSN